MSSTVNLSSAADAIIYKTQKWEIKLKQNKNEKIYKYIGNKNN
jgi:hypothetical protein